MTSLFVILFIGRYYGRRSFQGAVCGPAPGTGHGAAGDCRGDEPDGRGNLALPQGRPRAERRDPPEHRERAGNVHRLSEREVRRGAAGRLGRRGRGGVPACRTERAEHDGGRERKVHQGVVYRRQMIGHIFAGQ